MMRSRECTGCDGTGRAVGSPSGPGNVLALHFRVPESSGPHWCPYDILQPGTEEIQRFSELLFCRGNWRTGLGICWKHIIPGPDFQYQWNRTRQASISDVEFPFPYRKGPEENWWQTCIAAFFGRRFCLFRHLPAPGRPSRRFFRLLRQWERNSRIGSFI